MFGLLLEVFDNHLVGRGVFFPCCFKFQLAVSSTYRKQLHVACVMELILSTGCPIEFYWLSNRDLLHLFIHKYVFFSIRSYHSVLLSNQIFALVFNMAQTAIVYINRFLLNNMKFLCSNIWPMSEEN